MQKAYQGELVSKDFKRNIETFLEYLDKNNIPGDIIELGVYKGKTTKVICDYLIKNKSERKYYGFDTFSGYLEEDITTQPWENNKKGLIDNQKSERWNIDYKALLNELDELGMKSHYEIFVGDLKIKLKECIDNKIINKISFLLVDCNAFLPSYTGMILSAPVMDAGSIVMIDEHTKGGETMALEKFCLERSLDIFDTGYKYPNGPSRYCIVEKK